jgi:fluoride exporter
MPLGQTTRLYLAVSTGAALGALLRFAVNLGTVGAGLPVFTATGIVNVVGSLVIGFFATLSGPDGRMIIGPVARQFVMTGICGGLTTFSSMSLDAFAMLLAARPAAAALYLAAVVGLSLAAVWAGHGLAARLNR